MRSALALYAAALALTGAASLEYAPQPDRDCDSDLSCAYLAVSLCEAGRQELCTFPNLPDEAVAQACADAPWALACRMRYDR